MGATILAVDDDECLRELLYLHLSQAGYRVLVAEDAIVAGHFLLDEKVDLLIADIEMPFMDGLDLVRAIRDDSRLASLPVIFLTSQVGHEGTAKQLGAAAYLRKPLHLDELLGAVATHSQGRATLSDATPA
jgi:DNA-binding response OmpR family regulator